MDYAINSISFVVEQYLKDQILSARLKSGMKIIEKEVADTLEISRAPVREAMSKLSQQGLIAFSPRRGHSVLEIAREEILEIFQIRISLELQVLRILVSSRRLTAQDYENLAHLTDEMGAAQKQAQSEEQGIYLLNSLDLKFHRYLWQVSGSVRRAQLLEGLFFQLLIVMNQDVSSLGTGEEKAKEHRSLIKALQTNNIETICREFRCHLDKYITTTLGTLTAEEEQSLQVIFSEI